MTYYRHTQTGWMILYSVALPMLLFAGGAILWEKPIWFLPSGLLLAVLMLFSRLTVEVDEHDVRLAFGIGLIQRRIDKKRIESATVVRNHWYYGWGIKLTPKGLMWNVSGLDAVELTYTNGKRFRIGTDEPQELIAALQKSD